jgi:hypothetical protein
MSRRMEERDRERERERERESKVSNFTLIHNFEVATKSLMAFGTLKH